METAPTWATVALMIRAGRDFGTPPWRLVDAPADWLHALEGFYAFEQYMSERESRELASGGGMR